MKRFILLTFLVLNSFAYEFKLNPSDLNKIESSKNKEFILNRLEKYEKVKIKVKNFDLIRKLSHINSFINKIIPAYDLKNSQSRDYWATPKEFLIKGKGDCEDYAITKYFTLLELGIPKEKLYFCIVNVKAQRTAHMVLLYFEEKNSVPLVLDNLSSVVITLDKRKNLIPKIAFNELGIYTISKNRLNKKVVAKNSKFDNLLEKVYKDNL